MFSVTATIFAYNNDKIVLGKRSANSETYPEWLSLPGGFIDAKHDNHSGETVREGAVREIKEEIGLTISQDRLKLIEEYSSPDVDPRAHVVNLAYKVELTEEEMHSLKAGDDISEIHIRRFSDIPKLAFNHNIIVSDAIESLC